jgi:hypothetical protein
VGDRGGVGDPLGPARGLVAIVGDDQRRLGAEQARQHGIAEQGADGGLGLVEPGAADGDDAGGARRLLHRALEGGERAIDLAVELRRIAEGAEHRVGDRGPAVDAQDQGEAVGSFAEHDRDVGVGRQVLAPSHA